MYSVTVRESLLIAHRLKGELFGPAQNLHGATYLVDAEFSAPALTEDNVVIDIGYATRLLADVLTPLNYHCLDAMDEFEGINTTTEYLAYYVHTQLRRRLQGHFAGALKVSLRESDRAWGCFAGDVP